MSDSAPHIVRAWLESLTKGVVELDRARPERTLPRFTLGEQCAAPGAMAPAPGIVAGRSFGYFLNSKGEINFVYPLEHGLDVHAVRDAVYLAGDFNGWQAAIGVAEWQLHPAELDGERVLMWTGEPARFLGPAVQRFKFVTAEHPGLPPPE